MNLSEHLKNYQIKPDEDKKKITNARQYWIKKFATKIEAQKKRDNLYRFWLWRGKKINPKYTKQQEMDEFRTAKLPKDRMYLRPWKDSTYAIKLSHVKTEDLPAFYDKCMRCDDSKGYNFTVCFFHSLKVSRK